MVGIRRINIVDRRPGGRGSVRFRDAEAHWPLANEVYRQTFADLGFPLAPGYEVLSVHPDSVEAKVDSAFAIDVLLTFADGRRGTLQEKFLFVGPDYGPTVTVEHWQDPVKREPGDWHKMRAQFLFVGYDYLYTASEPRRAPEFHDWMLLNVPSLLLARAPWRERQNGRDGARASFCWLPFSQVPKGAVVACNYGAY